MVIKDTVFFLTMFSRSPFLCSVRKMYGFFKNLFYEFGWVSHDFGYL